MRPYLILDTYLEEAGAAADMIALVGDRPTETVRPPFGDAVPARADAWAGLLLTGSAASATDESIAWLEPLRALVRDALERSVPIFGICFGHQVLAQATLGNDAVRRAPTPELGWREIEVCADHPLLDGLEQALINDPSPLPDHPATTETSSGGTSRPRKRPWFRCFLSHFDEVVVEDGALDIFARSPHCAVHGFQVPDRPAFGVQFHPEMPPAECERLVREYLPRVAPEADAEEWLARAVDRRPLGRRILENFFRLVDA